MQVYTDPAIKDTCTERNVDGKLGRPGREGGEGVCGVGAAKGGGSEEAEGRLKDAPPSPPPPSVFPAIKGLYVAHCPVGVDDVLMTFIEQAETVCIKAARQFMTLIIRQDEVNLEMFVMIRKGSEVRGLHVARRLN